jgi:hypothetical protein
VVAPFRVDEQARSRYACIALISAAVPSSLITRLML